MTESRDPFSLEARVRRLEERMAALEAHCGINGVYDNGSALATRIDYLEDWRRDQQS